MKNVLIVSSSPRLNGNSDTLARSFEKGALGSGDHVDFVNLATKRINYCLACYGCAKNGRCIQRDDFNDILEPALKADVIVLATPTYFYSMSGQLKVFIDRLVSCYTKIRADIYILITAWDSNEKDLVSTLEAIRGCTSDCFEDCPEKGVILALGVSEKGQINDHPEYLDRAFTMGRDC